MCDPKLLLIVVKLFILIYYVIFNLTITFITKLLHVINSKFIYTK